MSLPVHRRPGVARETVAIASHMADDNVDAAVRFLAAVETTLSGLAEMPGKGSRRNFPEPRLRDLRSYAVAGFPNFLIFYTFDDHRLLVVAVLHGARDLPRVLADRVD